MKFKQAKSLKAGDTIIVSKFGLFYTRIIVEIVGVKGVNDSTRIVVFKLNEEIIAPPSFRTQSRSSVVSHKEVVMIVN